MYELGGEQAASSLLARMMDERAQEDAERRIYEANLAHTRAFLEPAAEIAWQEFDRDVRAPREQIWHDCTTLLAGKPMAFSGCGLAIGELQPTWRFSGLMQYNGQPVRTETRVDGVIRHDGNDELLLAARWLNHQIYDKADTTRLLGLMGVQPEGWRWFKQQPREQTMQAFVDALPEKLTLIRASSSLYLPGKDEPIATIHTGDPARLQDCSRSERPKGLHIDNPFIVLGDYQLSTNQERTCRPEGTDPGKLVQFFAGRAQLKQEYIWQSFTALDEINDIIAVSEPDFSRSVLPSKQ